MYSYSSVGRVAAGVKATAALGEHAWEGAHFMPQRCGRAAPQQHAGAILAGSIRSRDGEQVLHPSVDFWAVLRGSVFQV